MMLLSKWITFFGTLLLIVSFVWAFRLRKAKNAPRYFKFFYWLPLVRVLQSFCVILNIIQVLGKNIAAGSQNLVAIIEFCLTTLLFYSLYHKKEQKKFVVVLFVASAAIAVFLLATNYFDQLFFHLNAFFNFSVFLLCLYYYRQLLKNFGVVELSKDPTFWLVLGFFIFSTVTLPLYAIEGFIRINYGRQVSVYVMIAINLTIITEHLLFMKAYRCAPDFSTQQPVEADDFPPLDIM